MRTLILFVIACLCFIGDARAEKVRIVTRNVEPFSFEKNGRRVGFAMDLWDLVAREAGLEYEVQVVPTAPEMIQTVEEKKADVGVGALSVTAQREQVVDFSQPFYEAGLQVIVSTNGGGAMTSLYQLLAGLLNWQLIGMFLLIVVTMFIISHLVWKYEHPINSDMWPREYKRGMWESFWWTISTLLVGGADNKGPVGVGGRIVAILWMLLSIVLVSLLTASSTTTLTVNSLTGDINGPGDLPGRSVATIEGSTSESWLKTRGSKVQTFADVAGCIAALKSGKVEAIVYDAPMLRYAVNNANDKKLATAGPVFDRQNYAFAVPDGSPLRERINRALLAISERGAGADLRKKWFGEDQ